MRALIPVLVLLVVAYGVYAVTADSREDRKRLKKRRVAELEDRLHRAEQQVLDHVTVYGTDPFATGLLATLRGKKELT